MRQKRLSIPESKLDILGSELIDIATLIQEKKDAMAVLERDIIQEMKNLNIRSFKKNNITLSILFSPSKEKIKITDK